MKSEIINVAITVTALVALVFYYNFREKKLLKMADKKFLEIREKYLVQIGQRKTKEKNEIARIKDLVLKLERKHQNLLAKESAVPDINDAKAEADKIIALAHAQAEQIQKEADQKAKKHISDQKAEIETKMVDLVINVTKKVLKKSLGYKDHVDLIESALMEVEGESNHDA